MNFILRDRLEWLITNSMGLLGTHSFFRDPLIILKSVKGLIPRGPSECYLIKDVLDVVSERSGDLENLRDQ